MVKRRVIPCLDVADGRVVKGVRFENLREMGDPVELATRYSELGADELVFLDITATLQGRRPLLELVEHAAEELEIPFTVGGGVTELEDARGRTGRHPQVQHLRAMALRGRTGGRVGARLKDQRLARGRSGRSRTRRSGRPD